MGQKVHPKIFRTGVIYSWESKWFASKKDFAAMLREDTNIKSFLRKKLKDSSLDHIDIERTPHAMTVTVHTGKPGMVIGRGGTGIEDLKKSLRQFVTKGKTDQKFAVNMNVIEVGNPSLSAHIVMASMIADLEKRLPFRRVLKQHLDRVQKAGAKGVKLLVKGRLNGAEIARDEKLAWGSVPLHNLRADIDFASGGAQTAMGVIGVKVWIYRGEVFADKKQDEAKPGEPVKAVPLARPRRAAAAKPVKVKSAAS